MFIIDLQSKQTENRQNGKIITQIIHKKHRTFFSEFYNNNIEVIQ